MGDDSSARCVIERCYKLVPKLQCKEQYGRGLNMVLPLLMGVHAARRWLIESKSPTIVWFAIKGVPQGPAPLKPHCKHANTVYI